MGGSENCIFGLTDLTVSTAACLQGSQDQFCKWFSLAHKPGKHLHQPLQICMH